MQVRFISSMEGTTEVQDLETVSSMFVFWLHLLNLAQGLAKAVRAIFTVLYFWRPRYPLLHCNPNQTQTTNLDNIIDTHTILLFTCIPYQSQIKPTLPELLTSQNIYPPSRLLRLLDCPTSPLLWRTNQIIITACIAHTRRWSGWWSQARRYAT